MHVNMSQLSQNVRSFQHFISARILESSQGRLQRGQAIAIGLSAIGHVAPAAIINIVEISKRNLIRLFAASYYKYDVGLFEGPCIKGVQVTWSLN